MLESVQPIEIIATVLFAVAVIHTFSVSFFAKLAEKGGRHAGLWHYLAEVEAVFGVWAFILLVVMAIAAGTGEALDYIDTRNFTEPLFVFAIMVVAASRPILDGVGRAIRTIAGVLPLPKEISTYLVTLSLVPLTGSFITEPAAMTLAALLLRDAYFSKSSNSSFKYATIAVLFVNVSIGGVLTNFAAPPVLMVREPFGWDTMFMLSNFGWRAATAVFINAIALTFIYRKHLLGGEFSDVANVAKAGTVNHVPAGTILIHLLFLAGVVVFSHHPAVFMALLLLFIGFTQAYNEHQDKLMITEGLMVGFFLAGLVTLGGLQQWWLQDLLGGLPPLVLFWGSLSITAVTDNAALTYLGSLVTGTSDLWRYMLVAGAVTGGGLTVIANAPNPAGFSILKGNFENGTVSPGKLLLYAILPTLVAAGFMLINPPG